LKIYYSDTQQLFEDIQIRNFVAELDKLLGPLNVNTFEDFVNVVAQLIANVTAIHEHVGQVSDYTINPTYLGTRLEAGKEVMNVQAFTQLLCLTVMTGLKMPWLLDDWSHLIRKDLPRYDPNLRVYNKFKHDLFALQKDIEHRNKTERRYPFQSFNPEKMETSVSV